MLRFLSIFVTFFVFTVTINNGIAVEQSAPTIECGLVTPGAESSASYPWHISIYSNEIDPPKTKYLCGGTLISQNIIITAAHCVTDYRNNSPLPKDKISVAAGKYYRKYDDSRESSAQLRKLKEIHVMDTWKGDLLLYQGDIAVLVTDENLQFSSRVQPVCVDYSGTTIRSFFENPKSVGLLAGFDSRTADTGVLKEKKCSYLKYDECQKQLPEHFQRYLVYDKFCTVFENQDNVPCLGNSGSGVIFKNPTDNRHYLAGILSVSPKTDDSGCTNSLATNVTRYADKIAKFVTNHSVSV